MRRITIRLNWTPEPAHAHRPDHPHARTAWFLLTLAMLSLAGWGALMAAGAPMGGRADLLLGAFAGLMLAAVLFGFRSVTYLEPARVARERIVRWRLFRMHGHPHASLEEAERETRELARIWSI